MNQTQTTTEEGRHQHKRPRLHFMGKESPDDYQPLTRTLSLIPDSWKTMDAKEKAGACPPTSPPLEDDMDVDAQLAIEQEITEHKRLDCTTTTTKQGPLPHPPSDTNNPSQSPEEIATVAAMRRTAGPTYFDEALEKGYRLIVTPAPEGRNKQVNIMIKSIEGGSKNTGDLKRQNLQFAFPACLKTFKGQWMSPLGDYERKNGVPDKFNKTPFETATHRFQCIADERAHVYGVNAECYRFACALQAFGRRLARDLMLQLRELPDKFNPLKSYERLLRDGGPATGDISDDLAARFYEQYMQGVPAITPPAIGMQPKLLNFYLPVFKKNQTCNEWTVPNEIEREQQLQLGAIDDPSIVVPVAREAFTKGFVYNAVPTFDTRECVRGEFKRVQGFTQAPLRTGSNVLLVLSMPQITYAPQAQNGRYFRVRFELRRMYYINDGYSAVRNWCNIRDVWRGVDTPIPTATDPFAVVTADRQEALADQARDLAGEREEQRKLYHEKYDAPVAESGASRICE